MRAALVSCFLLAACLDSNAPPPTQVQRARQIVEPLPPLAPEPVQREAPVDPRLDDTTEMRRPIRAGRLTVIPLVTTAAAPVRGVITLDEGIPKGLVVVTEASDSIDTIDRVLVSNRSNDELHILGGEIIIGGNQDRVVTHDLVIAAGRTQSISVLCVELGRWGGTSSRFGAPGYLAEPSLRRLARTRDQGAVWREVDRINTRDGVTSSGTTYRFVAAKHASEPVYAINRALDAMEDRGQVIGVAIAIDDRVTAIERFSSAALFAKNRAMLVGSYTPLARGKTRSELPVGFDDVRAFIAKTAGARARPRNP